MTDDDTWWARLWATIHNPVRAAGRTFLQTTIGVWLAGLVTSPGVDDLVDLTLLETAFAAGVVSAVTFVYNMLGKSASYE